MSQTVECSFICCRSQWQRGLRRRSAAARLLRSWVRIPPGAWIFVCCVCCVLSGRGLCDELITLPEESYRLWCVVVCDLENLKNEEAMTRVGSQRHKKNKLFMWRCGPNRDRASSFIEVSKSHVTRLHIRWDSSGRGIGPSQRLLTRHNTHKR